MDEQAELNEIAARFAAAFGARVLDGKGNLGRSRDGRILRQIMLEQAGHIDLGQIRLEDGERGYFNPEVTRSVVGVRMRTALAPEYDATANRMAVLTNRSDVFAPIGSDLRAGVPFTDCLVGTATDPETGMTARALRFTTLDKDVLTEVEVAAGRWHVNKPRERRLHYTVLFDANGDPE
jgi:hypothetical protein